MYKSLIGNIFAAITKTAVGKSVFSFSLSPSHYTSHCSLTSYPETQREGNGAEMFLENFSITSVLDNHRL